MFYSVQGLLKLSSFCITLFLFWSFVDSAKLQTRASFTRNCTNGTETDVTVIDCGPNNPGCFTFLKCPDQTIYRGCGVEAEGYVLPDDCDDVIDQNSILKEKIGFGCQCCGENCNEDIPQSVLDDACSSPAGAPFKCGYSDYGYGYEIYCSSASHFQSLLQVLGLFSSALIVSL